MTLLYVLGIGWLVAVGGAGALILGVKWDDLKRRKRVRRVHVLSEQEATVGTTDHDVFWLARDRAEYLELKAQMEGIRALPETEPVR